MLQSIIIGAAMTVSAPVLAQTAQPSATPGATTQAMPAQTAQPATTPDAAASAGGALPADQPPAQANATATAKAAAPANKADTVAQVVETGFPTYDKDANGSLSKTEFSAWMVALKSESDPKTKADDPATKTWATQAFASADTDKSKSVSKRELEKFLGKSA